MQLRNVAIIAHVDHGKTTLVDALLADCGVFREGAERVECVLDSNELERERGITVLAKNVAVVRGDLKVNIIDTPGHADFGGEVERVLSMADGALLLVDAFEGPMPQTRYVLRKALRAGLRILVVINKCDKPSARPHPVLDEIFDLFVELGAHDEQLDFPVLYASGRQGWVRASPDGPEEDTRLLFEAVLRHVPSPRGDAELPARLQVSTIDHNDYVGRVAIGRVERGVLRTGAPLVAARPGEPPCRGSVTGLLLFEGLERVPAAEVSAGDIVAVVGYPEIRIGDTLCDPAAVEPLPVQVLDEPTISMDLQVNDSPFAGREGRKVTGRQIGERLRRELRSNVALRLQEVSGEVTFRLAGRGVLHLGILIETMRREGYEMALGRPRVIERQQDGVRTEPVESLTIDVPPALTGRVLEIVGTRRAELLDMQTESSLARLVFKIPSRGLIGLRTQLLNQTSGEASLHHIVLGYEPFRGELPRRAAGMLVSTETGTVTNYALDALQDRGQFFVQPGERVYVGQVVGENCRENDIEVNVCREKKLTNIRAAGADRALKVAPARVFSLEDALEYIEDDELVEVTPVSVRLRKKTLDSTARQRARRARV